MSESYEGSKSYEAILVERRDDIEVITLNRPERLNAWNPPMSRELSAALLAADRDDAVRSIVLTGAGRAFCAGGDISTLGAVDGNAALHIGDYLRTHVHPVARAVTALQKPYLCAVNGAATGAGMDMALMADIRWAARSARFSESYVKVGLVPGDGGAYLLPRLVGLPRAKAMVMLGEGATGAEAVALGLAYRCVDTPEALVGEAETLVATLAAGPTRSLGMSKTLLNRSFETDLADSLELEGHFQALATSSPDLVEGMAAFREKRDARFTGA
mgnify:CR=1 FL=1